MERHPDQGGFRPPLQQGVGQLRLLDATAGALDHEGLVFGRVPIQQVSHEALGRLRPARHHAKVFLLHLPPGHGGGEGGSGLLRPGIDHQAAHRLVQPVNAEDGAAQLPLQQAGHPLPFRLHPHGLEAEHKAAILISYIEVHGVLLFSLCSQFIV